MNRKYHKKSRIHKSNIWEPIPKETLKEFRSMTLDQLDAQSDLLEKELKDIKAKVFNKKNPYYVKHEKIKEKYWTSYKNILSKLRKDCEDEYPPPKNTLLTSVSGKYKAECHQRLMYLDRYTHWILREIENSDMNNIIFNEESHRVINNYRKKHGMSSIEEEPVDPTKYLTIKEIEKYQSICNEHSKITFDFHKKKSSIGLKQTLLNIIPRLKKEAIQNKKMARLDAHDAETREIGSREARKERQKAGEIIECPYCQRNTKKGDGHVDHINPISNGGLSVENNMVLVCKKCNLKKKYLSLWRFCEEQKFNYAEVSERLYKLGKWI